MTKYSNSLQASNLEVKESLENLGQRLRANRIALGWTIKDIAARLLCFKIPIDPLRLVALLLVLESLPMHFGSLVKLTL